MNFTLENLLLAVITGIAWLVIPPLMMRFTPLGKVFQHRKEKLFASLKSITRPEAAEVTLEKKWWPQVVNGLLFTFFMLAFPLLLGKYIWTGVLHVFYPGTIALFPVQGEFIVMIISFILGVMLAIVLSFSIFLAVPKVGMLMATHNLYRRLVQFKEITPTRDKQEIWWQLTQLAGKYDLLAWYRGERNKFAWALLLLTILSLPFMVWISLTNVRVTEQEIIVRELLSSQRRYTWDQVEEIEVSIDSISGRKTRQTTTFTFIFTDGTKVDVWGGTFANIQNDLLATCDTARALDVKRYVSPLMGGRLENFNTYFQEQIETVMDRCSTPIIERFF